jgi:hypothetical protein
LGPPEETPEEKLRRVEAIKLGWLQEGVQQHPLAAEYGLADWDPFQEGFGVEVKIESIKGSEAEEGGDDHRLKIRQHFKIVGPNGRPQFRSIDHAITWVFKRRDDQDARSAQAEAKAEALKKRHVRVPCPEWAEWAEASSAAERRHQCLEMLAALGNADEYGTFTEPVPPDVEGYSLVISDPMDLTTMAATAKADAYESFAAFRKDLALIVSNALTWNKEHHRKGARLLWAAVEPAFLAVGGALKHPPKAPDLPPDKKKAPQQKETKTESKTNDEDEDEDEDEEDTPSPSQLAAATAASTVGNSAASSDGGAKRPAPAQGKKEKKKKKKKKPKVEGGSNGASSSGSSSSSSVSDSSDEESSDLEAAD